MIKSIDGTVRMEGKTQDLLIDLTFIMRCMINKGVASKYDILECVKLATMTEEDLKRENKKLKDQIIKMIDDMDDIGDALNMLGALHFMFEKGEK